MDMDEDTDSDVGDVGGSEAESKSESNLGDMAGEGPVAAPPVVEPTPPDTEQKITPTGTPEKSETEMSEAEKAAADKAPENAKNNDAKESSIKQQAAQYAQMAATMVPQMHSHTAKEEEEKKGQQQADQRVRLIKEGKKEDSKIPPNNYVSSNDAGQRYGAEQPAYGNENDQSTSQRTGNSRGAGQPYGDAAQQAVLNYKGDDSVKDDNAVGREKAKSPFFQKMLEKGTANLEKAAEAASKATEKISEAASKATAGISKTVDKAKEEIGSAMSNMRPH